jgi:hypothetical protein
LLKSTEINNVVVGKIRSIKVTGNKLFVGFVETLSARYCKKKKNVPRRQGTKGGTKEGQLCHLENPKTLMSCTGFLIITWVLTGESEPGNRGPILNWGT